MLNKTDKEIIAVRTRFAPSPTGDPHVGSIWIALFNWLYARHYNGKFILRIEDTDRARFIADTEVKIIEALRWFGLDYDEGPDMDGPFGPYRQSERLNLYHQYAEQLIANGAAYYCFCSLERLQKIRKEQELLKILIKYDGHCRNLDPQITTNRRATGEPTVVRLRVPLSGQTIVDDLVRGRVVFKNSVIDDQVLLKSDGWPTYHLASVVDDHFMQINPVIRAEEWLSSTPKQLLLYEALGWTAPRFAHLPLILGSDRSKLSKRHGSMNALKFRDDGYLPEAVINFLALLGWNPKTNEEYFTRSELIKRFDLRAINKAGAIYDRQKLDWFNAHYLRSLPKDELVHLAKPYFEKAGMPARPPDVLARIVTVAAERAKFLSEIPAITTFFFKRPEYEANLLNWKQVESIVTCQKLNRLLEIIKDIREKDFTEVNLENTIKSKINDEQKGVGETLWPMRVALTGLKESPSPFTVASVLGKEETINRISEAIKKLS